MYEILLIDDEPFIIKVLQRLLTRTGDFEANVSTVRSAEEALRIIDEKHFDLIISDNLMEGIDGAVFFRIVHENILGTKRILLSGSSEIEFVEAMLKDGIIDIHMEKPWDSGELLNCIAGLLSGSVSA